MGSEGTYKLSEAMRCGDFLPHEPNYLPATCCGSCHEDHDEGYVDLMDYGHRDAPVIPEGRIALLCCTGADLVRQLPIPNDTEQENDGE